MQPWQAGQSGAATSWWIEWLQDGRPMRRPLDRPIRIGRDPRAEICLTDPTVSRAHAIVSIVDGSPYVDAHLSRNGIRVGAIRTDGVAVAAGQSFEIGTTSFRVVQVQNAAGPVAAPAAVPGVSLVAPAPRPVAPPRNPALPAPWPAYPAMPARRGGNGAIVAMVVILFALVVAATAGFVGYQLIATRGVASQSPTQGHTTSVPAASIAPNEPGVDESTENVVRTVSPSVVTIQVGDACLGSGVIYAATGEIVTNAHVADCGDRVYTVTLSTGKEYSATWVGSDSAKDIAVIRIVAAGLVPASFGNSDELVVGQHVLAIGAPLGLGNSATEGIVSGLGRSVPVQGGTTMTDMIQTSAAINSGNSGGALVDLHGRVMGIPTLTVDPSEGSGIGFAIPSNTAVQAANQLIAAATAS